jgi:hypothetical protein
MYISFKVETTEISISDEWTNKYGKDTMDYHFTIKRNEVLIHATIWKNLERCLVKQPGHKKTNTV